MKKLIVGGTFDESGGKPSYIISQLADSLGDGWECVNGGNIQYIRSFLPISCDVLIWMPNVSNDEVKVVNTFKQYNPNIVLVQSKRVIEKEYTTQDVIGRLLKSQSAYGIMITKPSGAFNFNLISVDGSINIHSNDIQDIGKVLKTLL